MQRKNLMRQKTIDKIRDIFENRDHPCGSMNDVMELLDQEERAEQMSEDVQELIYLANVVDSFIVMSETHPLYKSVRRDVEASLTRLKHKHKCLPDDA